MINEFEFSDFYFLNDVNVNNRMSSDEISALQLSYEEAILPESVIKISGMSDDEEDVIYTYAKFFEILDEEGLSGLVK